MLILVFRSSVPLSEGYAPRKLVRYQGAKMSDDQYAGGDHQWVQPRHFELESGHSISQTHCIRCGRHFVFDTSSGTRHAVHVSIFSFARLSDEVTERWLYEPCPGKRLPSDDGDREKQIAKLLISWERSREEKPAASDIRAKA
jgi:hypothetical protein